MSSFVQMLYLRSDLPLNTPSPILNVTNLFNGADLTWPILSQPLTISFLSSSSGFSLEPTLSGTLLKFRNSPAASFFSVPIALRTEAAVWLQSENTLVGGRPQETYSAPVTVNVKVSETTLVCPQTQHHVVAGLGDSVTINWQPPADVQWSDEFYPMTANVQPPIAMTPFAFPTQVVYTNEYKSPFQIGGIPDCSFMVRLHQEVIEKAEIRKEPRTERRTFMISFALKMTLIVHYSVVLVSR